MCEVIECQVCEKSFTEEWTVSSHGYSTCIKDNNEQEIEEEEESIEVIKEYIEDAEGEELKELKLTLTRSENKVSVWKKQIEEFDAKAYDYTNDGGL